MIKKPVASGVANRLFYLSLMKSLLCKAAGILACLLAVLPVFANIPGGGTTGAIVERMTKTAVN